MGQRLSKYRKKKRIRKDKELVSSNTKKIEESSIEEFEGSNIEEFEGSNTKKIEESSIEEFEGSNIEEFEGSNIEEFEGSSTKESKESDIEEFEESGTKEFEGSSTKESEALNDWFNNNTVVSGDFYFNLDHVNQHQRRIVDYYYNIEEQQQSFEFGKSGNAIIDDFIFEKRLKWIPYNKFKNVEYLDKGGFGTVYKAIWSNNNGDREVILKCHNDLNDNSLNEFLNEWKYHESCLNSSEIINFYGFTKDPDTLRYMVAMDCANMGNLRANLTKLVENNWKQKLHMLHDIIAGLNEIHNQNLIHCDFHDGNILLHNDENGDKVYISDLGLCRPVKSFLKKHNIYGVMTFMAPEVLKGNPYTPASDIYSFSMIMWEFTSGISPYNNRGHDMDFCLSICNGERPEIIKNSPQCYVDLMKKCWNEVPLNRPSSEEVLDIIEKWIFLPYGKKIEDINEELKCNVLEFINAPIGHNKLATKSHPKASYTSLLSNFTNKELNKIPESEDSQAYHSNLTKLLDVNNSAKLNEILESEMSMNNCNLNDYFYMD